MHGVPKSTLHDRISGNVTHGDKPGPDEMQDVPKSTLHDRISGNVTHGDKPGPDQLLSSAEEEELSNFLIEVRSTSWLCKN